MPLLSQLLHQFYQYNFPHFPIVESANRSQPNQESVPSKLIGFLGKKNLNIWVADIGRLQYKHHEIPKELLVRNPKPKELLKSMESQKSIPVLDTKGITVSYWNESQLLEALSQNEKKHQRDMDDRIHCIAPVLKESTLVPGNAKSQKRVEQDPAGWLGNLLLKSFPLPLYACDLQGKTLFFNGLFEERILNNAKLKKSIRYTENYLIELVQKLLAEVYSDETQEEESKKIVMKAYDETLNSYFQIVNLEENKQLYGYFFQFHTNNDSVFYEEASIRLKNGLGLDHIMDQIESKMIFDALKEEGQNISHTAKTLKVKRSTLQNRIKQLEIEKQFGNIKQGPIRRRREKQSEKASRQEKVKSSFSNQAVAKKEDLKKGLKKKTKKKKGTITDVRKRKLDSLS